jgi:peptidoglycan/LPS O-acetylase OafA/YrhL
MYYLDIVLTALLAPAVLGTLRDRLLGIFFLQGFTPESNLHVIPGGWTLGVEGLFYCCLPFLLRQIRSLKSALLYLCLATPLLMTGSWWLNHRLHDIHEEYLTLYWFPIELPVFLLGVTIYFLWKEKVADNVRIKENARIISLSLLAVAAAIYVKNLPLDNHRLYFSTTGYGFLLLAVAIHPWRLLVNRVTVFIGKISFSIYLLHFWFLPLAVRYTLPLAHSMSPVQLFVLRFFLTLLPTGVLATLTWFYIEETGIRLGRRFIAWLEDRPLRQPATVPSLAEEWRTDRASGRDEQF